MITIQDRINHGQIVMMNRIIATSNKFQEGTIQVDLRIEPHGKSGQAWVRVQTADLTMEHLDLI